jgi:hypothetical protein
MILHFSHMGFTDGLTFMLLFLLLRTPGNPATGEVIGRHLHRDFVTRQDSDEIHPEFSGNVGQNNMAVSYVYLEFCVGKRLNDNALNLDHIGFCQVLSLLVWITIPAKLGEGLAEFTVGQLLSASDLLGCPAVEACLKNHMPAFFPLRPLQTPGLAVRQQEEISLHPKDEEELSRIPAGSRFYNV